MSKPTILIVDDEAKFLKSLSLIIKRDFNVLTAPNGKDGLSLFESHPEISLILLDLDMPVMNGVEMLKSIRKSGSDVKVLIMTGNSTHEWAIQCADLIVHGYMQKPFDTDDLIEKINKLLEVMECKVLKELWQEEYGKKFDSLSPLIKNTISGVKQNIESSFSRKDIASQLNVTSDHISKFMRREIGMGLNEYINRCKVLRSKQYLSGTSRMKTNEIATKLGIENVNHFCRLFKKYEGLSPNQFKKSISSRSSLN